MGAILSVPCRRRRRSAPIVISHPQPLARSASGMTALSSRPASTHRSRRRSKGSTRPTSQISVIFDETTATNTSSSTPRHSKDSSHMMALVTDADHELDSQEQLSDKTQQPLRKSSSANSLASSLASQRANRTALPDVPEEVAQVDAQLLVTEDIDTTSPKTETHARAASYSSEPSSVSAEASISQASHTPTQYCRVGAFRKRSRSTRPPTASAYTKTSIHSLVDSPSSTLSEQAQTGWRQFAAQQKAARPMRPHASAHPYVPAHEITSHVYISPPTKLREITNLPRKRSRERPGHLRKVRRVEGYDWIRPEDLNGFESTDGLSTKSATPTPSLELTPSPSFQTLMTSTLCV